MKSILVTGGAGYIGSHLLLALQEAGYNNIVVLDNLSTGVRRAIPTGVTLVEGDVCDKDIVQNVLSQYAVDTIFHLAGVTSVSDSMLHPEKYFHNNTEGSKILVDAARAVGIKRFIFSSTAAVYGSENAKIGYKIPEEGTLAPVSPYGQSKLDVEEYLQDLPTQEDFQYAILRYFNVVGADAAGRAGLWGTGESLMQIANDVVAGRRETLQICGTDYPTPDGTGVRDFIHVTDLVRAHVQIAEKMIENEDNYLLNVGYGEGASVQEVVTAYSDVLGTPLPHIAAPRRDGDLCYVVSDVARLEQTINWHPLYKRALSNIVQTDINWTRKQAKEAAVA